MRTIADILPFRAEVSRSRTALLELGDGERLVRVSFSELKDMVGAFASALHERGVRPARTVALLMPNSRLWVVAYYAIFRLGGIAVPIEYGALESQPDRVRYSLDHAEAAFVICDARDADRVRNVAGRSRDIIPAQEAERDGHRGKAPPQPDVRPSDLAQILYTSGTTGHKKGVELTHGNIVANVRMCCARLGVVRNDCLPALLPYHHAFPLTITVILPLYAGVRMAVGDITERRSRDLLRLCRPTVFVGVPRVLESILAGIRSSAARSGQLERLERARCISALVKKLTGINIGKVLFRGLHRRLFGGLQLRCCVSGGARISIRILHEYFLLGIPIVQGWGMSELSPVGTVQRFWPARFTFTRHYERKAGSIGFPLDGTQVTLIRGAGESVSGDAEDRGEMVIKGPQVMRGYHKDPERTAEQMTPQGLRSGDIARRDRDGDFTIIGRVKHVVVLASGKKVFPEDDLEEELALCTSIDEFAIRPISDEAGAEKIGIIIRPNVEALRQSGVETMAQLYGTVKKDIERALREKPDYMKQYDFCLTAWTGGEFAELVKSALGDACPLRNPFTPETAYSRMKGSTEPVPW
ncbi:MAG: AMP-binding protein [Candidatus Brocadiae bacterium]|nr:AMP-binding protein [Candidatus Brocadiia bacterium]